MYRPQTIISTQKHEDDTSVFRLNIQTDSYHNFPSSFDKLIIQEGSGYMPHGNSSMFYARGVINGIEGVYTIGINNQTGVIYHRCFYEWNTFIKNFSPYK